MPPAGGFLSRSSVRITWLYWSCVTPVHSINITVDIVAPSLLRFCRQSLEKNYSHLDIVWSMRDLAGYLRRPATEERTCCCCQASIWSTHATLSRALDSRVLTHACHAPSAPSGGALFSAWIAVTAFSAYCFAILKSLWDT